MLAKKLVKHCYCNVKKGEIKNLKEDITAVKEIELQMVALVKGACMHEKSVPSVRINSYYTELLPLKISTT